MKGFTLTELLIVIGISLILVIAAVPVYGNLQVQAQLNESTSQAIQALRTARERSVARMNNSPHGVYFDIILGSEDKYILYQGASYATRDSSYDRESVLDEPLVFSNLSFVLSGGDVDINFSEGLGISNNTGSLRLTHDVSGSRDIGVNSMGKVEED
jgi:prepilin-type N-terminal cleavage/methylation domain-containing protein